MTNYIIVDSNHKYAKRLYQALTGGLDKAEDHIIIPSYTDTSTLSTTIIEHMNKLANDIESNTIILLNADVELRGCPRQHQPLVEVAFWLRCKARLKNAIVFYSLQSLSRLLKTKPENAILHSPGVYHLRQQLRREQLDGIADFAPLEDIGAVKPYLKPKINLALTRHRYANYVSMVLMAELAQKVWEPTADVLDRNNELYGELVQFLSSLDFHLLRSYFDLYLDITDPLILSRLKTTPLSGTVLIIDDLASGWKPVIGQMLYGLAGDNKIGSIDIATKIVNDRKEFDLQQAKKDLRAYLEKRKPQLILLDLRLSDEEGKKELKDLGGYQLLRFIKTDPCYKGLPVIMFTASSNAETIKGLIDSGAEAVWTKPGVDENLNTQQIIDRYEKLLRYVDNVFKKYEGVIKVESGQAIEESRLRVLQKLEYIRYRAKLNRLQLTQHYFNKFTDILVDTNVVLEDAEVICNIYKLAQVCGRTQHTISVNGTDYGVSAPKLIFLNYVVDEIIHWSKRVDPTKRYFWKVGLLAYDVVRGLFQDDLARTEYNTFKKASDAPECMLMKTKQRSHADPVLIREVMRLVSGKRFDLERPYYVANQQFVEKKPAAYKTGTTNVLLITNESSGTPGKIPELLKTQYSTLKNPIGKYQIINIATFNDKIEAIRI